MGISPSLVILVKMRALFKGVFLSPLRTAAPKELTVPHDVLEFGGPIGPYCQITIIIPCCLAVDPILTSPCTPCPCRRGGGLGIVGGEEIGHDGNSNGGGRGKDVRGKKTLE
jgi:hypothetical protein